MSDYLRRRCSDFVQIETTEKIKVKIFVAEIIFTEEMNFESLKSRLEKLYFKFFA